MASCTMSEFPTNRMAGSGLAFARAAVHASISFWSPALRIQLQLRPDILCELPQAYGVLTRECSQSVSATG